MPSYRACDIYDNRQYRNVLLQVQYIEQHMNQWLLSGLYNATAGLRPRPWLYKAAIDKRYHAAFHYDRLSLISDGYWTAAARLLDPWQYFLLPAGCLVLDERRRSYRVRLFYERAISSRLGKTKNVIAPKRLDRFERNFRHSFLGNKSRSSLFLS